MTLRKLIPFFLVPLLLTNSISQKIRADDPQLSSSDRDRAVSLALGNSLQSQEVINALNQHTLGGAGIMPETQIQPGDVLVYLNTPDQSGAPANATVYDSALQGFKHASLAAKDKEGNLYHLDAPIQTVCNSEFRGPLPYVVLHPKASVTGDTARFQSDVSHLASQFQQIGYEYDTTFSTEVSTWPKEKQDAFRDSILAWKGTKPGPTIPPMYCSSVPVTIYSLLGIQPKASVTATQALDLGFAADLKSGKPPAQIAADSAHTLLEHYIFAYEQKRNQEVEIQKQAGIPEDGVKRLSDDIKGLNAIIDKLKQAEPLLTDLFRVHLGLQVSATAKKPTCQDLTFLDRYMTGSEHFWNWVYGTIETRKIEKRLAQPVIRPADLLRDAASPNGNYEISGYYPGNLPNSCDVNKGQ